MMSIFRKQIKEGDKVKIVKDSTISKIYLNKTGVVLDLCYNPYFPNWLSPPNYNVKIDVPSGNWENSVFSRDQLKLIK